MKNLKKLTILHSNDMHGDFLAEQIDEKLVGGVSFLSGYVNMVRRQEKNVLYAIAGDMFRGSVIDSEYPSFVSGKMCKFSDYQCEFSYPCQPQTLVSTILHCRDGWDEDSFYRYYYRGYSGTDKGG